MQWILDHFLLIILLAAGAATFAWLLAMRKRLQMKWYMALLLSVLHVLAGVACVKVFARMEGAGSGAMSIFGAVLFMPVLYFLGAKLFKRPMAEVFDIFAVPMIFTLLCSRINCLKSGCCLGLMIPGMDMRWPTREAEMVFYVIFLAIFIPKVWKRTSKGRVYPAYMAAYGIFRGIVECFRESSSTSFLHISHIWALLSLAIGLGILWDMQSKQKKGENAKGKKHK